MKNKIRITSGRNSLFTCFQEYRRRSSTQRKSKVRNRTRNLNHLSQSGVNQIINWWLLRIQ